MYLYGYVLDFLFGHLTLFSVFVKLKSQFLIDFFSLTPFAGMVSFLTISPAKAFGSSD